MLKVQSSKTWPSNKESTYIYCCNFINYSFTIEIYFENKMNFFDTPMPNLKKVRYKYE
jgi:hypothetical protein